MWKQTFVFVFVGLVAYTSGATTTPAASTSAPTPIPTVLPKLPDKALVLTTFDDYGWGDNPAQMRTLLGFPWYDNNLQATDSTRLSFTNSDIHLLSVDLDYERKNVYMYDYHYGIIVIGSNYSTSMNTSEMEFKIMHHVMSLRTVQVAYDWLSHTVYWTDPSVKMIMAASGDWDKVDDDIYKIIVKHHLDAPDGIAVDPLEGFLFWSDNGLHPKIERALPDGSNRHTIISNNLKSPMSLECDIHARRLYWLDTWTESIVSSDYDGLKRKFITRMSDGLLFDMAVYRDVLYVTDIYESEMYTLDKNNGRKKADAISYYYDMDETIYGVAVYSNETQTRKEEEFCAEKKCEQMCASTKHGGRCMCGEGYKHNLTSDKCYEDTGVFHLAFVYANVSHICLVDIRSIVSTGFFEPHCIFTMIKQKPVKPTNAPANRRKRQAPSSSANSTTQSSVSSTPMMPNQTHTQHNGSKTLPTTTPTPTTTATPPPTVAPPDRIKMIELNMKDRNVFFATQDNTIYEISVDASIESDAKRQLVVGDGNITGMSFDPEDRILYWLQDNGQIRALSPDSKEVTSVGYVEQYHPTDLIVLIDQRRLAYIAGEEGSMGIYTMNLDGSDTKTVVEDYDNMMSLVFERSTLQFHFLITGKGRIGSIRIDDSEQDVGTVSYTPHPQTHILLEYHEYYIWVYASGDYPNLIMSAEKTSPYSPVGHNKFDNVSTIVGMKILDASKQATKPSLCAFENGGCAHICITKLVNGNPSKACECKKGYTLAKNKLNCTSEPLRDNFLLISDWTNDELLQVSLDVNKKEVVAIPARENYYYSALQFDSDTMRIWWSAYDYTVYSSDLDGLKLRIEMDIGTVALRLAKDSSTGNVYYISNYYLGVITPSGHEILLNDDFWYDYPTAIAIHPKKGYLYYAVEGTFFGSYIARSFMDGKNETKIIEDDDMISKGLAIDYIHDYLFIGDSVEDTIIRCNLDGQECIKIVNTTDREITDMVVDGSYLYYTAYKKDFVVRVDLNPPYTEVIMAKDQGLGKINCISLYSSSNMNIQPVKNACSKNNGLGDCSTICLPTPNGRTCACEAGTDLQLDGRTCSNVHQCDDIITHQNPETNETIEISFHSSCLRRENSTCEYKCPANYSPVNKSLPTLTCKLDGWDRETHVLCQAIVTMTSCAPTTSYTTTPMIPTTTSPRERRCPATFTNGAVSGNCSKNVGSFCDFTCNAGFVKSQTKIFCRDVEEWHGIDGDICKPYKCDASISHGTLGPACARTVGTKCSFKCDKYYAPPKKVTEITCGNDGWNLNTSTICTVATCDDNTLAHGKVVADCSKIIGITCNYSCDQNFTKLNRGQVVCNADMKWHPKQACTMLQCPMQIEKASVGSACSREVGSVCTYSCDKLYTPVEKLGNITCLSTGLWNQSNLCIEPFVTIAPQASTAAQTGLSVGLVILAIVILILIVLAVVLYKRRQASSAYATASFKNGGNIAIENPGYRETNMTNLEIKDDYPYSNVDPNQMQPAEFQEKEDGGMTNPMYGNETLPEVAHVEVSQDKTVLTYDSWLKEQQKK